MVKFEDALRNVLKTTYAEDLFSVRTLNFKKGQKYAVSTSCTAVCTVDLGSNSVANVTIYVYTEIWRSIVNSAYFVENRYLVHWYAPRDPKNPVCPNCGTPKKEFGNCENCDY